MLVVPATWEAEAEESLDLGGGGCATTLQPGDRARLCLKKIKIIQKVSQAWWRAPVIPVTWEVEVGKSLEPSRQRSQ